MSFNKNIFPDEQFYEELIKRFFHRQSYFYYCLQNYLNSEADKKQLDKSTSEIVCKLIEFLINSKDPLIEFKEISNAKKFNDFYATIKSELSQINLSNLDKTQTKNIIQGLALQTLENFIQVFSNEDNRFVLQSYLDLKLRLRSLLEDSNGNGANLSKNIFAEIESNGYLDGERADLIDQTSILAEVFITGQQQEEKIAFQKFFEEEIRFTLRPITDVDTKQTSEADFIKKCYDIYFNLIELGKFHNNHELVIISEKVSLLIKAVLKLDLAEKKPIIDLIQAGNRAIEHFVFSHHTPQQLNKFLKKYDDFLWKLGIKEKDAVELKDEMLDDNPNNYLTKAQEEKNVREDELSLKQAAKMLSVAKNKEFSLSEENMQKDILQFTLPGEKDEDLMNLIQEISSSITTASTKHSSSSAANEKTNFVKTGTKDNSTQPGSKETFYKEAHLFIQVILNAISQMTETNDDNTYMEDIELASSSLKILAKKCEFNKIVFLPELIESICINIKKTEKRLPKPILEKIKEGILLLTEFNPENATHESKLLAVLSTLKKYYSFTVNTVEKASPVQ